MRVIHRDGRTGEVDASDWKMGARGMHFIPDETKAPCGFGHTVVLRQQLRPLGPIEEDLLRVDPEKPLKEQLSPEAYEPTGGDELTDDLSFSGKPWRQHALSESLEACARIWEQHGVAL